MVKFGKKSKNKKGFEPLEETPELAEDVIVETGEDEANDYGRNSKVSKQNHLFLFANSTFLTFYLPSTRLRIIHIPFDSYQLTNLYPFRNPPFFIFLVLIYSFSILSRSIFLYPFLSIRFHCIQLYSTFNCFSWVDTFRYKTGSIKVFLKLYHYPIGKLFVHRLFRPILFIEEVNSFLQFPLIVF